MNKGFIDLLVAVFLVFLFISACSVSHDDSDNSAWNCIWAVIILLGWLKVWK